MNENVITTAETAAQIARWVARMEAIDRIRGAKVRRNEPCPCKSGKKFKKCCWKDAR